MQKETLYALLFRMVIGAAVSFSIEWPWYVVGPLITGILTLYDREVIQNNKELSGE